MSVFPVAKPRARLQRGKVLPGRTAKVVFPSILLQEKNVPKCFDTGVDRHSKRLLFRGAVYSVDSCTRAVWFVDVTRGKITIITTLTATYCDHYVVALHAVESLCLL